MPHPLPSPHQLNRYSITRLVLTNFRNYESLRLELSPKPVVLTGPNGSGKTNILEAISLLSPGRGLRSITLEEADRRRDGATYPWGIAATIDYAGEEQSVGTGRNQETQVNKRIVRIDGKNVRSQTELAKIFSVMWLTPQMDGLFLGGASERRKFLDRLVYNFDSDHASRVYSYEHTVRERAKLLQNRPDPAWLSVLENKMAERAVAIAAARLETLGIIQQSIQQAPTVFPKASTAIEGAVEQLLAQGKSALEVEETLKNQWLKCRPIDAASGRTHMGPHRSDLVVVHSDKQMPAASCSTGEQKALLLSIILAEARAKAIWKNSVPVLLLDEVVAHLDESRRHALFDEFLALGSQVWLTGTDLLLFKELHHNAEFMAVKDGAVVV